jgi:hypothetical protein
LIRASKAEILRITTEDRRLDARLEAGHDGRPDSVVFWPSPQINSEQDALYDGRAQRARLHRARHLAGGRDSGVRRSGQNGGASPLAHGTIRGWRLEMKKFLVLYLVPPSVIEDRGKTAPDARKAAEEKMRGEWNA